MSLLSKIGIGKKARTPGEIVKHMNESLQALHSNPKNPQKILEDIFKDTQAMRHMLYGDSETDPIPEVANQLASEILQQDLLHFMIISLPMLEFESRKDVTQIFNNLLKRQDFSTGGQFNGRYPTVDYLSKKTPSVVEYLLDEYENREVALNCGLMLRECFRHESLTRTALESEKFYKFFQLMELPQFDVASDAFATFRDLLSRHKTLCASFLEENYDRFTKSYTKLLLSENYVTRRQSLKLLGELLLDRPNFNIMTRYISDPEHLKLIMTLLKDRSKLIQFEAFHVFKIFVANPYKPKPIVDILLKNQEKLIKFLSNFQNNKDDEQFADEKILLLKEIANLQPIPSSGSSPSRVPHPASHHLSTASASTSSIGTATSPRFSGGSTTSSMQEQDFHQHPDGHNYASASMMMQQHRDSDFVYENGGAMDGASYLVDSEDANVYYPVHRMDSSTSVTAEDLLEDFGPRMLRSGHESSEFSSAGSGSES